MSLLPRMLSPGYAVVCAGLLSTAITLGGCASSRSNASLAYDSDTAIADRVHQAMSADTQTAAALEAGRIRIRVMHGNVTLLGDADNVMQMADALAAVRSVGGVHSVQSDLHLRAAASLGVTAPASISESARTDSPKTSRSE
ncbi:BON domain-containing protein [Robbsia sp. KACC 23696]|uniref:BON domain-containing protein n=1 Tax=Robbsia sp. KACC 23696 TaxID=3149231 RepID=UPI00325B8657